MARQPRKALPDLTRMVARLKLLTLAQVNRHAATFVRRPTNLRHRLRPQFLPECQLLPVDQQL